MEIYNQMFRRIEKEVLDLSYLISIEEGQKKVYSSHIAELCLRLAGLLESSLKYRYSKISDEKLKYDENKLIKSLGLTDKKVFVHWEMYKIDKRVFQPFKKNEERVKHDLSNVGKDGDQNYGWNNAYQSLRHNLVDSIRHYGTLEYLFEILAATFVVLGGLSDVFFLGEISDDGKTFLGWKPSRSGIRTSASID